MIWRSALAITVLSLVPFGGSLAHAEAPTSQPSEADSFGADPASQASHDEETLVPVLSRTGVHQAQLAVGTDGTVLLLWVQTAEGGPNLWLSRRSEDGEFAPPAQVNAAGQPVSGYPGDEARPSIAVGPKGRIGIAWIDKESDVMAVVGEQHGETLAAPVRLNQDSGEAMQTMPRVAFTPDGALHTIWLDSRIAAEGMEEPADLYYARLLDGEVTEKNLTGNQETTVCGCCRPFLESDQAGKLHIAFRNSTADGYRDIFRIESQGDGDFSEPAPSSQPSWELKGCPMAGPVISRDVTVWKDGSTGKWRLLASRSAEQPVQVLIDTADGGALPLSPRKIRTSGGLSELVLVPGEPNGRVLRYQGKEWKTLEDDLPSWVSSASFAGGKLLMLGTPGGKFELEERTVAW